MKQEKPAIPLDPVKIFLHAASFHKSYDFLCRSTANLAADADNLTKDQRFGIIAHPAMVLSVFASELYLKCLLCVEKGVVPAKHDLMVLFEGLDVSTRHELDDLWDADIRRPERKMVLDQIRQMPNGQNLRLDLRYALEKGANAFNELRYFYEREQSFFLLSDFPFLIRKAILRRMPSWTSLVPKPSKGYLSGPGVPNG
jgi:hypothetical protein